MHWKMGPGVLVIGALVWAGWCFAVVTLVMPAVLRKLTVWPGTTAYVLCLAPLIAAAAWRISATVDD